MIPLPTSVQILEDSSKEHLAKIIIEPLYSGYGHTIGSLLRRVFLSSMPGAAVIGVKIKGASHEFSTLANIAEDVLEIILNLKKLRLKIFSGEREKLILKAKGEKEVYARDISKNSNVFIVNPDCLIATLTDKKAELEMEIFAEKGMGYQPVEERENREIEIGAIAIDAIFTPIQKVGYEIESIRVGKKTDYDKLILTLETDGTVSMETAMHLASDIILNHFQFIKETVKVKELKNIAPESEKILKKEDKKSGKKAYKKKETKKETVKIKRHKSKGKK